MRARVWGSVCQAGLGELPHLVQEFVPLVLMREVQVSKAGGDRWAPPFLQAVQIGLVPLVVLGVQMVVQPFLEPEVLLLGAVVPGLYLRAALLDLYNLFLMVVLLYLLEVVLLGLLVAQGLRVLVFRREQILAALVFRGVMALAVRLFREALFLGVLEVPLFLELAYLWLDLDRPVVLKIPGVPEDLEAVQTCFFVFSKINY